MAKFIKTPKICNKDIDNGYNSYTWLRTDTIEYFSKRTIPGHPRNNIKRDDVRALLVVCVLDNDHSTQEFSYTFPDHEACTKAERMLQRFLLSDEDNAFMEFRNEEETFISNPSGAIDE